MSRRLAEHVEQIIERAAELASRRGRGRQRQLAPAFIRQFYRGVPPQDLIDLGDEAVYGAAISALALARRRRPDTPLVRIYNPDLEQHGWRSPHTVIELVNDDMPFLVDSVTTELNRRDLTVHLVIHPTVLTRRDARGEHRGPPRHAAGLSP